MVKRGVNYFVLAGGALKVRRCVLAETARQDRGGRVGASKYIKNFLLRGAGALAAYLSLTLAAPNKVTPTRVILLLSPHYV
jgi:hypothetical protein